VLPLWRAGQTSLPQILQGRGPGQQWQQQTLSDIDCALASRQHHDQVDCGQLLLPFNMNQIIDNNGDNTGWLDRVAELRKQSIAAAASRACHGDAGLRFGNGDSGGVTVGLSETDFQVNGSRQ
jgi:hypothetical protein